MTQPETNAPLPLDAMIIGAGVGGRPSARPPASSAVVGAAFCGECGAKFATKKKFCSECGERL